MSNLDKPIEWTQFFSVGASRQQRRRETLKQIAGLIRKAHAIDKKKLPWIKLGIFGDQPSDKGSLKTNENLHTVTGVEADYDGGIITAKQAAQLLKDANILGLVYTTPSNTDDAPRWRVLCPFSGSLNPKDRLENVDKLNGVLGGDLDKASWNVSLSYYYGTPDGGVPVQTFMVDGDFIDLRDDLPKIPKWPDEGPIPPSSQKQLDIEWEDFAEAVRLLDNTGGRYGARDDWRNIIAAIHHQSDGDEDGRLLAHEFSKPWPGGYDPEYTDATWESLGHHRGRQKTGAFILQEAKEFGWKGKAPPPPVATDVFDVVEGDEGEAPEEPVAGPAGFEALDDEDDALLGPPPKARKAPTTDDPVEQFNTHHAVVQIGNKVRILREHPIKGSVEFLSESDFKLLWRHVQIPIGPKATMSGAELWLSDPRRRTYHDVVFQPEGKVPASTYNLSKGFPIQPSTAGSCQRFLDHLYENVCLGRDELYTYAEGWMAHMFQHPGIKPGVALVLRGKKGIGKDVVGHHLGKLCPRNYVNIAQMSHLTGKFNAHLAHAIFVQVEEAFWAGDKAAEGPLKNIITAPTISLEKKGIDVITVDNFARVFITSNEKWVVPATADERRYVVFEVSEAHRRDYDYFAAMEDELKAGGYARLMDHMLKVDLSDFEVRDAPDTEGLGFQKVQALKGPALFWRELLQNGDLPQDVTFDDLDKTWERSSAIVKVDALHDAYRAWWGEHRGFGHGDLLSKADFGKTIQEMCPTRTLVRRGPRNDRYTAHLLPNLSLARAEFEGWMKSPVEWPEEDDEDLIG